MLVYPGGPYVATKVLTMKDGGESASERCSVRKIPPATAGFADRKGRHEPRSAGSL